MLDSTTVDGEPEPDEPGALATFAMPYFNSLTNLIELDCSNSGSCTASDTSPVLRDDISLQEHISLHIPTAGHPGAAESWRVRFSILL